MKITTSKNVHVVPTPTLLRARKGRQSEKGKDGQFGRVRCRPQPSFQTAERGASTGCEGYARRVPGALTQITRRHEHNTAMISTDG